MCANVAGAWQKVTKMLQDCSTKQPNSAEAVLELNSVTQLLDKLEKLPPAPRAVWKKLVQQLKVRVYPMYMTAQLRGVWTMT
jgi:hypothetical protein